MSIRLPKSPLMSDEGLSPLESQLVRRNIGGAIPKFGSQNLSAPVPKLVAPIPRSHRMEMPHIRMQLQPKMKF